MKPTILIVDDRPDELRFQMTNNLEKDATTIVVHPNDAELSDLVDADLVLVDYRLDAWSVPDALPVALRPSTGMALAVVLREQADLQKERLTAFALHTGHLVDLRRRLPSATVQHVLARLNNLEWIFAKEDSRRFKQMILLAKAIRKLPKDWPSDPDQFSQEVERLLGMVEGFRSLDRCWSDVWECRMPVQNLTQGEYGIPFVRWLLHEILPYPSFLWRSIGLRLASPFPSAIFVR